ncbi:MAG: porin family protein [Rikenellaceae bacterium]
MRIKRVLTTLLLFLVSSTALSQEITELVDTKKKEKKLKSWQQPIEPPNQTVMEAWAPVTIDHYIGVRGGYGMGTVRFEPAYNTSYYMGLMNIGLLYRFDIPSQKYVGCIEANIEYLEKGYQYETYNESGIISSRRYSTIMISIPWQPYLPLSKNGSRFYLNAGPFFSYAMQSSYRTYYEEDNQTITEGEYEYDMLRDNRMEYGLAVGAGLSIALTEKVLLGLDFRYNITLSDTFKSVTKYASNPFRSPVDQINIGLTLAWKFRTVNNDKNTKGDF